LIRQLNEACETHASAVGRKKNTLQGFQTLTPWFKGFNPSPQILDDHIYQV